MNTIQYLKQYRYATLERLSLLRRREELFAKYAYPRAIQYSDMPKAHNVERDLSDYVVKLKELEDKLDDQVVRCITIETEILTRIGMIDSFDEREVLRLRYIDLDPRTHRWRSFENIARRMHYGRAQVFRIHRNAIKHFHKPNDDTK